MAGELPDYVTVEGYGGVAFRVEGGDEHQLRAHMVGDDTTYTFDVEECTVLSEDEFCHDCGQLGCGHGRS